MDVQKLSALSASLARVVSSAEDEEAELDQFPVEGVREAADCILSVFIYDSVIWRSLVNNVIGL